MSLKTSVEYFRAEALKLEEENLKLREEVRILTRQLNEGNIPWKCPTCASLGFKQSAKALNECEFCDGTYGGVDK